MSITVNRRSRFINISPEEEIVKKVLILFILLVVLCMASGQAIAETVLISSPLDGGDSGLICACTNLTKNVITVDIQFLRWDGTAGSPFELSINPGFPRAVWTTSSSLSVCKVSRTDGKSLSSKHVACNLMASDVNNDPVAVVPVDIKFKQ